MIGSAVDIRIGEGGIYLSASVCEQYFGGVEAVILLRWENDIGILPVRHAAAGGYLLKRRNLAGDCLVFAPEFFEHVSRRNAPVECFEAQWDDGRAALLVRDYCK
jgi:hypothetical protein